MKLPDGEDAVVPIEKLQDYCLNAHHPRGKHKARVFAASLGLNAGDAQALQAAIREAARTGEPKN